MKHYQSNAPFFHSYIKPTVKIIRKINIDKNPKTPIFCNDKAHGIKKISSKSKIKNKIPTKKNLMSNELRASPNASNPHSYGMNASFDRILFSGKSIINSKIIKHKSNDTAIKNKIKKYFIFINQAAQIKNKYKNNK